MPPSLLTLSAVKKSRMLIIVLAPMSETGLTDDSRSCEFWFSLFYIELRLAAIGQKL